MTQPYGPPGAYPYAGPPATRPTDVVGRRIGAFFIDLAIFIAVLGFFFFAIADEVSTREALRRDDCYEHVNTFDESTNLRCDNAFSFQSNDNVYLIDKGSGVGGSIVLSGVLYLLIPLLLGGTLGKLMVGLRVVDDTGAKAGPGRTALRWLFFLVDGPLTLGICGLVTSLANQDHQRVGDMVAHTYVVHADAVGRPPSSPVAPQAWQPYGPPGPQPWGTPPATGWPAPPPPPTESPPSGPAPLA
ncbi:MAG: RDD family protein [Acidimicrobiales bacterium]